MTYSNPHIFNQNIGKRIRSLRQKLKLSQSELAQRLGVSFQQVQKYEMGANQLSVFRLHQMAAALNISPEQLLESAQHTPPSTEERRRQLLESFSLIKEEEAQQLLLELTERLARTY